MNRRRREEQGEHLSIKMNSVPCEAVQNAKCTTAERVTMRLWTSGRWPKKKKKKLSDTVMDIIKTADTKGNQAQGKMSQLCQMKTHLISRCPLEFREREKKREHVGGVGRRDRCQGFMMKGWQQRQTEGREGGTGGRTVGWRRPGRAVAEMFKAAPPPALPPPTLIF